MVSHLGIDEISPSYVTKVTRELDEKVKMFVEKTIDSHIPYLFMDASHLKARDGIRYVSQALLVVAGVKEDGYREILGARVAYAEHEITWEGFFSDLQDRGLCSVDLVISDGHTGIQAAAENMFPGSSWQMSHVHFIRALLRKVSRKYYKTITERLNECLNDSTLLFAYARELEETVFSKAADTIYRFEPGLMNYRAFPSEHWKKIRTTNLLERVRKEVKRRTKSQSFSQ